jgi:hypothetical protein
MVEDIEVLHGELSPVTRKPHTRHLREPWKKGESGNVSGRPTGSRNRLSENFLVDLLAVYTEYGKDAIESVAVNQPAEFLKIIAKLLPKKAEIEISAAHEISITLAQRRRIAEAWIISQGDTGLSVNE